MSAVLLLYFGSCSAYNFGFGTEIPPYEADEISPLEEYVHRPVKVFKI
jgi:hypothetical protein